MTVQPHAEFELRDWIGRSYNPQPVWPDPHGFWLGGSEYPTGRGVPAEPERGWTCGCGRGYSPKVMQCYHCGPQAEPAGSPS